MGLVKYLMGGDSRKSLAKLNKMTDQVEALEPKYQAMDDETLKNQTQVLKDRLAKGETLDDISKTLHTIGNLLAQINEKIYKGDK